MAVYVTSMNIDDPLHLFYLFILLIGVGSFLFGDFRNRFSQSIQHLVVWAMIFMGAVVLYSFKDTLEAQLFPKSAVQTEGQTIVLSRAGDGHFYATLEVNRAPVLFVLDTGATNIVLSKEDARRAGFNLDDLRFTGRAMTANGVVGTAAVTLDQMVFEGRVDTRVRASVNEGELDTSLLGMAYLNRFSTIEISGDRLRLVP